MEAAPDASQWMPDDEHRPNDYSSCQSSKGTSKYRVAGTMRDSISIPLGTARRSKGYQNIYLLKSARSSSVNSFSRYNK